MPPYAMPAPVAAISLAKASYYYGSAVATCWTLMFSLPPCHCQLERLRHCLPLALRCWACYCRVSLPATPAAITRLCHVSYCHTIIAAVSHWDIIIIFIGTLRLPLFIINYFHYFHY
jgi:hypothetical protein